MSKNIIPVIIFLKMQYHIQWNNHHVIRH